MADPHVISALRAKRAELAGLIDALEKQIAQLRADLVHVDGVLRLYQPEHDPEEIKPIRQHRRSRYFARGELARLCLEAFRDATGPLSQAEITDTIIAAKGFDAGDRVLRTALLDLVKATLAPMTRHGILKKIGKSRGARWNLAARDLRLL
jgi:hypothetical protein